MKKNLLRSGNRGQDHLSDNVMKGITKRIQEEGDQSMCKKLALNIDWLMPIVQYLCKYQNYLYFESFKVDIFNLRKMRNI